jgi:lysophospholipase L1-like esterase
MSGSASAAPDYVQCYLDLASDGYGGVALFHDATGGGGTGYFFYRFNGSWALYTDAGTTLLGSSSAGFASSTSYLMELTRTVSGSTATLTCYLNGTQIIQATDGTYLGSLYGGICGYETTTTYSTFETGTIGASGPAAGTLTSGIVTASSVALSIATDTAGTPPYSNQLQRSPHGANTWSNIGSPVTGATAPFTDTTVAANTEYDYQVLVTDSASLSATSNTVTITTLGFNANNASLVYYGRWAVESTSQMWTVTNGSICEFVMTGASAITLYFDATNCVEYPGIAYNVDDTGWNRATLTSGGSVAITLPGSPYNAVSYTTHRVRFAANINSEYPGSYNDWSSQRDALRFLGIAAPSGSLLSLPMSPNQIEFLGDSITAGLRMLYTGTDGVAAAAPEIGWGFYTASLLGLEPILNGHGGQGITAAGTDGTPAANSAFPYVFSGAAWSPSIKPAIVVMAQGTNDGGATQAEYQTFFSTIRSAYPSAYVFAIATPTNGNATAMSAAVTAQGDARMFYLNYTALSIATSDGTHPTIGGANTLGAQLASDIQTQLNSLGVKLQPAGGSFSPIGSAFIKGL